jgi:hypothetical protein
MGPLSLVNWRAVNRRFCVLMWLVAAAITTMIVVHLARPSPICAAPANRATASTRYAPPVRCSDSRLGAMRSR